MWEAMLVSALLTAVVALPASSSEPVQVRSLCIGKVEYGNSAEKSLANPAGGNPTAEYRISVDRREEVIASADHARVVSGLSMNERHTVRVFQGTKQIQSFSFRFRDLEMERACLLFKPLNQTWDLWESNRAKSACDCGP
jgi:hypothetical protein